MTEKLKATAPDDRPVNQSTVSAWVRCVNEPSGKAMVALQEITGTPVTDWLVPADPESSTTASADDAVIDETG